MDVIVELILMLIGTLTKDRAKGAAPEAPPVRQRLEHATLARIQQRQARALQATPRPTTADPAFRNAGWGLALVVCAVILLLGLLGAWALGVLPGA